MITPDDFEDLETQMRMDLGHAVDTANQQIARADKAEAEIERLNRALSADIKATLESETVKRAEAAEAQLAESLEIGMAQTAMIEAQEREIDLLNADHTDSEKGLIDSCLKLSDEVERLKLEARNGDIERLNRALSADLKATLESETVARAELAEVRAVEIEREWRSCCEREAANFEEVKVLRAEIERLKARELAIARHVAYICASQCSTKCNEACEARIDNLDLAAVLAEVE